MSIIQRVLLAVATALLGSLIFVSPASAEMPTAHRPAAASNLAYATDTALCSRLPESDRAAAGCTGATVWVPKAAQMYLPVERWGGVTTALHYRTGDGMVSDMATRLQREATLPLYMNAGNSMFSWATSMTNAAIQFDVFKSMGYAIDNAAATIGKVIFRTGLVAVFLIIGVVAAVWQARRGSMDWGKIVKSLVVTVLLAGMMLGASKSTGGDGAPYQPGKFSPGWIATTTNSIIASVASAPAAALTMDIDAFSSGSEKAKAEAGSLSCSAYLKTLNDMYVESGGGTNAVANNLESSVPMILSGMWETTGLRAWTTAQFGSNNQYGSQVYCRMLEDRMDIPAISQIAITRTAAKGGMPAGYSETAAPWQTEGNSDEHDRSMVAWAACRANSEGEWFVDPEWTKVVRNAGFGTGRNPITVEDCKEWWTDDYLVAGQSTKGIVTSDSSNIDWGGKASDVRAETLSAPQVQNFLLSLHGGGSDATGSLIMTGTYVFSSFVILLVFGFMSLAILVAKIALAISALMFMFVGLRDLLPGGDSSALAKAFKTYAGMAFGVFSISLIFALLSLFTGLLQGAFTSMFGAGSIMSMLGTGIAPLVSLFTLHFVFTKALKVPSPFSFNGAKAWGTAFSSGAVGGAVGGGIASRMSYGAQSMAMNAASRAGRGMVTGRGGRSGAPMTRTGGTVGLGNGSPVSPSAQSGASAMPQAGPGLGTVAAVGGGAAAGTALGGLFGRKGAAKDAVAQPALIGDGQSAPVALAGPTTAQIRATGAERRAANRQRIADFKERQGITGRSTVGQATAEAKHALGDKINAAVSQIKAGSADRKAEQIDRRGYGHGIAGGVREAITNRAYDVKQQFKNNPKAIAGVAGKGALAAGAIVATGGLAAPVIGGAFAFKQGKALYASQRNAVKNHRLGSQAAPSLPPAGSGSAPAAKDVASGSKPVIGSGTASGAPSTQSQGTGNTQPNPTGSSRTGASIGGAAATPRATAQLSDSTSKKVASARSSANSKRVRATPSSPRPLPANPQAARAEEKARASEEFARSAQATPGERTPAIQQMIDKAGAKAQFDRAQADATARLSGEKSRQGQHASTAPTSVPPAPPAQ